MKIINCLLFSFALVLCFCSCSLSNASSDTGNSKSGLQEYFDNNSIVSSASAKYEYMDFEESVKYASDIVSAKFISAQETPSGGSILCTFICNYCIKGDLSEQFIVACPTMSSEIILPSNNVATNDGRKLVSNFEQDKDYILVLIKHKSVYRTEDFYMLVSDIFIPTEKAHEGTIFGTEPLTNHSAMLDSDLQTEDNVVQFIDTIIDSDNIDSPNYLGEDYIISEDVSTIAQNSPYIVRLQITDKISESPDGISSKYMCNIVRVIKGEIQNDKIKVKFRCSDLIDYNNSEIIVCLSKMDMNGSEPLYLYSARNSVYSIDDENTIMQAISQKKTEDGSVY